MDDKPELRCTEVATAIVGRVQLPSLCERLTACGEGAVPLIKPPRMRFAIPTFAVIAIDAIGGVNSRHAPMPIFVDPKPRHVDPRTVSVRVTAQPICCQSTRASAYRRCFPAVGINGFGGLFLRPEDKNKRSNLCTLLKVESPQNPQNPLILIIF